MAFMQHITYYFLQKIIWGCFALLEQTCISIVTLDDCMAGMKGKKGKIKEIYDIMYNANDLQVLKHDTLL